jgi:hypothetical protein
VITTTWEVLLVQGGTQIEIPVLTTAEKYGKIPTGLEIPTRREDIL